MSIAGVKQTSGTMPVSQSSQDSREKNIQRQITSLQEKVRNVAYDKEMSEEEKSNEKKALQERIQTLNSELKQYQVQKQQEEDRGRQQEAEKSTEHISGNAAVSAGADTAVRADKNRTETDNTAKADDSRKDSAQEDEERTEFGDADSGVIISISSTKDQLTYMNKIRVDLEGRMRTAETDEEKQELLERINHVSKSIGEKIKNISDKIADNQKEEQERKDKISRIIKENEERMKQINVVIPKNISTDSAGSGYANENFTISIT